MMVKISKKNEHLINVIVTKIKRPSMDLNWRLNISEQS